jgi:hypothetical protein
MKHTLKILLLFLFMLAGKVVFAQEAIPKPGLPNDLDKVYVPDKSSIFNSDQKPASSPHPDRERLNGNPVGALILVYIVGGIISIAAVVAMVALDY